jgi:hypothetical protein
MLGRVVWQKFAVSEVITAAIIRPALMMEAVRTSETSVNFYETTRGNIPEDSNRHTRRHENLKSHCQSMFLPQGERQSFTPIQNNR